MIYALTSLVLAFIIAFGRQITVFGRIKAGLWFFSHFQTKRLIFSTFSIGFGIVSLLKEPQTINYILIILSSLLLLFSYFFDMGHFFPEANDVQRKPGKKMKVTPETRIIGVTISKTSVAYPLNELVIPRHLVLDKIKNQPVLISYCALCRSALAFKAEADGEELYFRVAGVWRRNMIIYDTKTYSLWQQATGECIYGKLKGSQLELVSGENTTWEAWFKKHKNSEFAFKAKEARKAYLSKEKMMKLIEHATQNITVPGFSKLEGLGKRESIFGITVNKEPKAYPKSKLKGVTSFEDTVGGEIITLKYDSDADFLTAKIKKTKEEILVEKHWWLGWKEFHPETNIWRE